MRQIILSQWRQQDGSDMTGLRSFNDSTSFMTAVVMDLLACRRESSLERWYKLS